MTNTRVTHHVNYKDEEDPDSSIYDQLIQLSSTM